MTGWSRSADRPIMSPSSRCRRAPASSTSSRGVSRSGTPGSRARPAAPSPSSRTGRVHGVCPTGTPRAPPRRSASMLTGPRSLPFRVFDQPSDRLRRSLAALTGRGRVSEADVDVAMREIRLALLEADVNFKVVRDFIARVREQAVGAEILGSLTAGQQIIKIVNKKLIALLDANDQTFHLQGNPAVIAL